MPRRQGVFVCPQKAYEPIVSDFGKERQVISLENSKASKLRQMPIQVDIESWDQATLATLKSYDNLVLKVALEIYQTGGDVSVQQIEQAVNASTEKVAHCVQWLLVDEFIFCDESSGKKYHPTEALSVEILQHFYSKAKVVSDVVQNALSQKLSSNDDSHKNLSVREIIKSNFQLAGIRSHLRILVYLAKRGELSKRQVAELDNKASRTYHARFQKLLTLKLVERRPRRTAKGNWEHCYFLAQNVSTTEILELAEEYDVFSEEPQPSNPKTTTTKTKRQTDQVFGQETQNMDARVLLVNKLPDFSSDWPVNLKEAWLIAYQQLIKFMQRNTVQVD